MRSAKRGFYPISRNRVQADLIGIFHEFAFDGRCALGCDKVAGEIAMKVALWGCGGHASVVFETIRAEGKHEVVAFVDDHKSGLYLARPIFKISALPRDIGAVIIATGDEAIRDKLATMVIGDGRMLGTTIHPSAVIAQGITMGEGSVVFAGAVLQPGASIGRNCIINTCASVDHDCIVEDGAQLAPRVALGGRPLVGSRSFVGIGSAIINGVRVGANCVIGAGSVVVKNIPDNSHAYGVPARVVRKGEAT